MIGMRRTPIVLALVAGLLAGCPGPSHSGADGGTDGGAGDGGSGDGGVATGQSCPNGQPAGCAGRVCLTGQGGQTYCSEYCSTGTCPQGFPCQWFLFQNGGDLRSVCAPECAQNGQCPSGTCNTSTGVCAPPPDGTVDIGGACGAPNGTCKSGLVCEGKQGVLDPTCMPTCNPGADAFCSDGAFCWPDNVPDGGVCWPGGQVVAGGSCTGHLDCPKGYLCIQSGNQTTCMQGCDPTGSGPTCSTGTCTQLPDRSYGFCLQ